VGFNIFSVGLGGIQKIRFASLGRRRKSQNRHEASANHGGRGGRQIEEEEIEEVEEMEDQEQTKKKDLQQT